MIKPCRGYILVEPIKADEKTESGFYLPEKGQEKPAKGKVIAVGDRIWDGNSYWFPNVNGYVVYYKRWGTDEIKDNGKEYKFVKFEDILGVIDEKTA